MKKVLKNPIFMFILGVVLTSGIAVTASQLFAKDVMFTPSNPEWTLSENTVEDAINDLYDKTVELKKLDVVTTATTDDILNGKTAYDNNGNLITGSAVIDCFRMIYNKPANSQVSMDFGSAPSSFLAVYEVNNEYVFISYNVYQNSLKSIDSSNGFDMTSNFSLSSTKLVSNVPTSYGTYIRDFTIYAFVCK